MGNKDDKETKSNPTPGLGDIGMIRDILMGQQINEFDRKFNELESSLHQTEQTINEKILNLKNQTDAKFSSLEKEIHERFDLLEKLVKENTNMLMETIKQTSKNDRHNMGKIFSEMSQKLMQ